MDIFASEEKGKLVLCFSGELDHHAARDVMHRADGLLDRYLPMECTLDLSGLRFMDSSGIAVILRLRRRMQDVGGHLRVKDPPPQPLRVLDIAGVRRLVPIFVTEKELKA